MVGGDGVEVAVPDGEVGVFAWFERADAIFEEELVGGPDGIGLQCGEEPHFRRIEKCGVEFTPNSTMTKKSGKNG